MQQEVYDSPYFQYLLSLPDDFEPSGTYPLILYLHGSGERGNDLTVLKRISLPAMLEKTSLPAIVVSPQCKADGTWNSQSERLKDFLEEVIGKYPVNKDAVSLTGISMGGYGAWQLATDYPEYFSALAVLCGGGMAFRGERIRNLPVRLYHGEQDPAVLSSNSKELYDRLLKFGSTSAELILYPDLRHGIWDRAYGETDLLDWLIAQRR